MTLPIIDDADAVIPPPAQRLPELRQAVATVAPSPLSEFFEEIRIAFSRAGEEDSVAAIRVLYRKWAVTVAIERRPATAHQLREAERAVNDEDPVSAVRRSEPPERSCEPRTGRPGVSERHGKHGFDDLPGGLPEEVLPALGTAVTPGG
ncbi:MAG: hypothetical protein JK586_06745 [Nocardiopsis sp. BM-2018]|uniref:Uncharacterized protein n=1 Tax=Nocardiopsis metallicus TaxID=179819 RepID=A0A840WLD2_9ACTN|nr:hypothetical protein [Nocardiopsis metallicus]MBB5493811.1 hypothetical protein [Nocardiopsis metallicus]QRN81158.1 MAG: hypothetical protein JK586_06745 [Nocardiopsis sp. BM-2018]